MSQHQQKLKFPPPFALSTLPLNLPVPAASTTTVGSTNSTTITSTGSMPDDTSPDPMNITTVTNSSDGENTLTENTATAAVSHNHGTLASKGIDVAQKSIHDLRQTNANTPVKSMTDHSSCGDLNGTDVGNQKRPGQHNGADEAFSDVMSNKKRAVIGQEPHGILEDRASDSRIVDILSTYLTEDVIIKVMNFCSISDLVHGIGMVNHYYHSLSYLDTVGWDNHYTKNILEEKWLIKLPPIPPHKDRNNKRTLYQYAVIDSNRQCITLEELCYDISGTIWSFRFKSGAGTDWTAADPWHQGQICRKMLFYQNGAIVLARIRPKEESTPTSQSTTATATTTTESNMAPTSGEQHSRCDHQPHFVPLSSKVRDDEELIIAPPPLPMTWRFITRPMDLPTRPLGGYIRIHVGNRDVPTYTCIRSPTKNWGFIFESCWGVYGNFELPPKRNSTIGNDATTNALTATGNPQQFSPIVTTDDHNSNTNNVNDTSTSIRSDTLSGPTPEPNIDRDTERQEQQQQQPVPSLKVEDMQDETLLLTNEVQWREAFLYNVGSRTLPEGADAAYEFDRFWQNNGNVDNQNNANGDDNTNNDTNNTNHT